MADRDLFDIVYDRRESNSVKYGTGPAKACAEIIPMWVADMDFRSPAEVESALIDRASQKIYGYEDAGPEYDALVSRWYLRRMGWEFGEEHILRMPGVMFSVAVSIRAMSSPGDAVMIFQPVYYPFMDVINGNGRKLVVSELVRSEEGYVIDYDDMAEKIRRENVRLLLFCSPHNPVGRVWRRDELAKVVSICRDNGVRIISDEIHSDFILEGRHMPTVTVEGARDITVTCVSPTKTFNLSGLKVSNLIAYDPDVRDRIRKEAAATGFFGINMMAAAASDAAYRYGDGWLDSLLEYLRGNAEYLSSVFPEEGPVSFRKQEGTYLSWLDMRALGYDRPAKHILDRAKVWLHEGSVFGAGGKGFVRMNIACPRKVLEEACGRIQKALSSV